ncbi:hypothetical protein [Flammeovirga aprica]|uniref:DUF481 domain-containing protein n=1 Tax=Flammeovirga aprica JL-4 TaxID=694437 RepID=A0A7X9XB27_9BACT|nr:hypothetical protein [Flammeovirga aprica]NME70286.1 hypothetical protein [Flammeovirga aprica JL-4]
MKRILLFALTLALATITNAQSIKGVVLGEKYGHSTATITSLGGHRGEIKVFKDQDDIVYTAIFKSSTYLTTSKFETLKKNIEKYYDVKLKFNSRTNGYYTQKKDVLYSLRTTEYSNADNAGSSSPNFKFEFQISLINLAQDHLLYLRDSADVDF